MAITTSSGAAVVDAPGQTHDIKGLTALTAVSTVNESVAVYLSTRYPEAGGSITETFYSTITSSITNLSSPFGQTGTPAGSTSASPLQQPAGSPTTTNAGSASRSTTGSSASTPSNAAASSSTSPPSEVSHGKYTGGELAGGIIGGAIGAAIIAFLATFFLCRRKNNKRSRSQRRYDDKNPRWAPINGGTAAAGASNSGSDNSALGWMAFLPDSRDDRTISNAIKTLLDQIELHVDNYYTKANVTIDDNVRADLALLDSKKLPMPVAQMMENPHTVLPTIKHCIANLLVDKITPGDNASRSLLPARFATFPARLTNSSMPAGEYHATQQAYSQWKRLSNFLFPVDQQDATDQRRLQGVSNELAESIYLAFLPWQSQRQNEDSMKQHERSLMTRASDVGQLIQSQPSAYEFEWSRSSSGSQFDVLPGFVKTSDTQGRPLDRPQSLVPVTTARL